MKISSVELSVSAVRRSQYPTDDKAEFLLVGRSNVGKSSFINTVINRKNYARTSSKPGKTQTLNFYLVNKEFYLVDVPGYGYATVSQKIRKKFGMMIEEYLAIREQLKRVFMLVDFRHKPSNDDILMYQYLKYYKLPVTVVAMKMDKIVPSKRDKQKKLILDSLKLEDGDDLVLFSSITKTGKTNIQDKIDSILNDGLIDF